jgi:hypothetical protein
LGENPIYNFYGRTYSPLSLSIATLLLQSYEPLEVLCTSGVEADRKLLTPVLAV